MGISLPRWVWMGACALACIAGMVNAVGFLGFEHQAITHLTGTTTLLGTALAQGDWRAVSHLAGMLLAFLAGAALSGMIIQDSQLRLGRRYGVAMTLESLLLLAAIPLFKHQQIEGGLLAACACGLQNAMATTYSGAIVRTTHVSGMFTDIGTSIGHALRGLPLQWRRLQLSVLVIGAFLTGGVLGALAFLRWHYDALLVPGIWTGIVGIGYALYHHWRLQDVSKDAST